MTYAQFVTSLSNVLSDRERPPQTHTFAETGPFCEHIDIFIIID